MNTTADILIVDDDASLRAALQDYLSGAGYAVRTADGGAAMDARLAEAAPDLVVLDVMMPGEDGLSICRRLQGRAPVLMLSAMGETTDRIVGLETGGCPHTAIREDTSMNEAAIAELRWRADGVAG